MVEINRAQQVEAARERERAAARERQRAAAKEARSKDIGNVALAPAIPVKERKDEVKLEE